MRLTIFDEKKVKALGASTAAKEEATYPVVKTVPWYKDHGLFTLNMHLIWPMFSQFVEGFDGSLTSSLQSLDSWQGFFNHPTGSILGLINAIFFVGSMVSPFFMPYISDRFGRKVCLQLGSLLSIFGAALLSASQNTHMYIAARFFLGLGNTMISIGPVLVAELAYPHHRSVMTALSNAGYSAGSIVAAWACFGSLHISNSTWAWRLPCLLQVPFSILQTVGIIFMPDSPRWYVARDRPEKAKEILIKYHGNGDPDDEVVRIEYEEIITTLNFEKQSEKLKVRELLRTKGNLWRIFCLTWCGACYQLSGNGLVSYYMNLMLINAGIKSQSTKVVITATSAMFSFACSLAFAWLPGRYGRRRLILVSLFLMWIVYAVLTATVGVFTNNGSKAASSANIAFIYLYNAAHNLGFVAAVIVFVTEIIPYNWRATGLAYFAFVKSAASTLNTYVNPIGMREIGWYYYFVYVAWIAIEWVVVYISFPETKGLALEEVAMIFDQEESAVFQRQEGILEKAGIEHVEEEE